MKDDERREEAIEVVKTFLDVNRIMVELSKLVGRNASARDLFAVVAVMATRISRFDAILGRVLVLVDSDVGMSLSAVRDGFGSVEEYVQQLRDLRTACQQDLEYVRERYEVVAH